MHVSEPESDDEFVFGVTDNHKAEKVSVMIGGVNVPMIIDSGASVNVIGRDVWEAMKQNGVKCTMMKADKKIYAYGSNTPLDLIGKFVADVNNQSQYEFYLTSTIGPALISKSLALDLGILHFPINHISLKHQIEHEYPKCFEGVGKLNNVSLKLKIDPEMEPKTQKMYRIPFSLSEKVESKLEELERMDVIEKVESPSQWVSPVIVVPIPGGKDVRLVVDMRAANQAVMRERHPIPTVDEVLHDMNGAKVFSKLDLKYGYHQIELDPDSREITTFVTHKGLFRYKRLIFGINAASEKFQNIISQVLQGCEGAQNISDDIVVYGANQEEHDQRLRKVMHKLNEANLTLSKEKCEFGMDEITFMGHVLSEHGIGPTEERVKDLTNAVRPRSISEVKSFLGLVNFSGRFIKELATKAHPLRELTKQNATFEWTEKEENSFQELKNSLTSSSCLGYFSLTAEKNIIDNRRIQCRTRSYVGSRKPRSQKSHLLCIKILD